LKEAKGTAGFILEMAELHMLAEGPFEELLEAIDAAATDL